MGSVVFPLTDEGTEVCSNHWVSGGVITWISEI